MFFLAIFIMYWLTWFCKKDSSEMYSKYHSSTLNIKTTRRHLFSPEHLMLLQNQFLKTGHVKKHLFAVFVFVKPCMDFVTVAAKNLSKFIDTHLFDLPDYFFAQDLIEYFFVNLS